VFCGEESGRAAALDLAFCELMFAMAGSLLHGMAMCAAESVPFEDLLKVVKGLIPEWFEDFATKGTETGDYEAGNSAMTTNAAALSNIVRVSREADIDARLPGALLCGFKRAIELGHGPDDLPSLHQAFKPPRSARGHRGAQLNGVRGQPHGLAPVPAPKACSYKNKSEARWSDR
jgi:hypothetical protein